MLYIADFMKDFHKKLEEVVPEDLKRELSKHERTVKHALYMVMGQHEQFHGADAKKFQEKFHVKIDQMAGDYQTWKRAGCKTYAKPKQYVTGRIAGASKKAFDIVLNQYLLQVGPVPRNQESMTAIRREENSWILQEREEIERDAA